MTEHLKSPRVPESKPKPEILLSPKWIAALKMVERVSEKTGIPYAIIGSLGVEAICEQPWHSLNENGAERDLDILALGTEEEKVNFHQEIQEQAKEENCQIVMDSDMIFGGDIVFIEGQPKLKVRNQLIAIDPRVLETIEVPINGISIPTIHPQTYVSMLVAYNRTISKDLYNEKVQERMDTLIRFLEEKGDSLPELTGEMLKPFTLLKNERELKRRLKELKRKVALFKEGNALIINIVDLVKKHFPNAWAHLKNRSS